tara:strand:- start:387 stop:1298 length:912 start_codon:yes stop_codon:yes gene_type:complete
MIDLPSGVDIINLIDDLRIFSWEASETLLYYSRTLKDSNNKSNILENEDIEDPVTLADLKVNEIIIQRISEKYKDIDWEILSEENVKSGVGEVNTNANWTWVLDPLDGTKDFIQGTDNYAMHLALNFQRKSFIGIVLIPEKDELWITNGLNTWCERKDKSRKKIPPINKNKNLQDMVLVTSKNHGNEYLKTLIDKVNFKDVIVMGSIGCKIASILRGESDIYICFSLPGGSSPKDWDFAAPEAIIKAAGGAITNLDNEELTYGNINYEQGGILVASNNKQLHKLICSQINEAIRKFGIYPIKD